MGVSDKGEHVFISTCRIIVAKELKVPPDDIDLEAIFDCVKRACMEAIRKPQHEYILDPKNKREMEAVHKNPHGPRIVDMILMCKPPFGSWVDKYETQLVKDFMKKRNRGVK
jgi:hypothetical protein